MIKQYFATFVRFAVYVLLQVAFFKDVVLFDQALCFIYLVPLLLLPFDTKPWQLMLQAFLLGFLVDVFYTTGGLHTAACTLIAFLRPYLLNLIVPSGGYDTSAQPLLSVMGTRWFLTYSSLMVAIHHLALFLIEAFRLSAITHVLLTTLFSSIFTVVVITVFQILFHRN
ncbi:Rod shape-determining protein MreD [Rhodoflexus sp.]